MDEENKAQPYTYGLPNGTGEMYTLKRLFWQQVALGIVFPPYGLMILMLVTQAIIFIAVMIIWVAAYLHLAY